MKIEHRENEHLDKLRPLVNNPQIWQAFLMYLEPYEKQAMGNLLQAKETEQLWRAQGFISALKAIKDLKDKVNV